jgi:hypothetical protein
MNMKKLLIIAMASMIGSAAFAQSGTPMRYGLKVGVNLPKYVFDNPNSANSETNTTTNFHVTGYLDAPLGSTFSLQPGLSLQGKGGEFFSSATTEVKQNTLWVEVPVNLVAHLPSAAGTHFFLGAGPYAAFAVAGQNKTTSGSTTTETELSFGNDSGDNLKGIDFGFNFLGGIQLSGFNIGAGYGIGLTDLRPSGNGGNNGEQRNRVWSFSVGFGF